MRLGLMKEVLPPREAPRVRRDQSEAQSRAQTRARLHDARVSAFTHTLWTALVLGGLGNVVVHILEMYL